jgi:RHH-type rel operon transcriptional repressor/antitoxin RelB
MPDNRNISLELEPEVDARLTTVADTLHRSRAWVVEQAIKEFLDLQSWQLAAIRQGLDEADAGKLIPHEEVVAWVESWGKEDERPMPTCE